MSKIKRVKCKSGLMGSQYRIQNNFDDYEDFVVHCEVYELHKRLGYKTIKGCWKSNPLIQSSVEPSDFRRVK